MNMDRQLFAEKIQEFLTYLIVERNLSRHTVRAYESDLVHLVNFWQLCEIQESGDTHLQRIMERYLLSLYHRKINKGSIARKLSCLSSFVKFLSHQGITLSLHLARPRAEKKLPLYLSIEEITHLLDRLNPSDLPSPYPYRDIAILELLYATGMRCSELVSICLRHINMQEKTITIIGKGNKERVVLFGEKAYAKLMTYLTKERPPAHNNAEYLFLNYRQEPITTRSIQRICAMFRPYLPVQRALTPHKIRHSFATHLLNQGVDVRLVQEFLGHASLASTEKYTHVSLEDLGRLCDTKHPINHLIKKEA
jgi:integrase/recombinase XerC